MKECLREEVLQSFLDGELQGQQMEHVAVHLAACSECAVLSQRLEQENNLLSAALAPEFEAAVPSEQLRARINNAIAAERVNVGAMASRPSRNLFSSLASLFAVTPQRAFAYSSLVLIIGFGLIMAVVRWQPAPTSTPADSVAINNPTGAPPTVLVPAPDNNSATTGPVAVNKPNNVRPVNSPVNISHRSQPNRSVVAPAASETALNHIKLLPGERSYLQTIAQLDSSINSEKTRMKPEVQAEYQRNLAVVDRTLAVARTAAKSNPNNPDAAEFMFAAYQSKVDLLNTVAEARVFDRQH